MPQAQLCSLFNGSYENKIEEFNKLNYPLKFPLGRRTIFTNRIENLLTGEVSTQF